MSNVLQLNLRSQRLAQDEGGHAIWEVETSTQEWAADQTALLLCDVWNGHWCRGAVERLDAMIERMDAVVERVACGRRLDRPRAFEYHGFLRRYAGASAHACSPPS